MKEMQPAKDCLVKLVEHVFNCRDGLLGGITYQELAERIGRFNCHEVGHAHGMGRVLGEMGHLLLNLEGQWGEPIPYIQSLVVNKTGALKDLPDDGIREFWPGYPTMATIEKRNRVRAEYENILEFGSRWDQVLENLNLKREEIKRDSGYPNNVGESEAHKRLKAYVKSHPEIVGADNNWRAIIEYALPSLDIVDVVFISDTSCIAVEVKSRISDNYTKDYERGIYQTIKYGAILAAMTNDNQYDIPANIQSVLVLESELPSGYKTLAGELNVKVIENVQPDAI